MKVRAHEFAATPLQLRKALELHRMWLERQLGVRIRDTVIFSVDLDLTEIAGERILGFYEPKQLHRDSEVSRAGDFRRDSVRSCTHSEHWRRGTGS